MCKYHKKKKKERADLNTFGLYFWRSAPPGGGNRKHFLDASLALTAHAPHPATADVTRRDTCRFLWKFVQSQTINQTERRTKPFYYYYFNNCETLQVK